MNKIFFYTLMILLGIGIAIGSVVFILIKHVDIFFCMLMILGIGLAIVCVVAILIKLVNFILKLFGSKKKLILQFEGLKDSEVVEYK